MPFYSYEDLGNGDGDKETDVFWTQLHCRPLLDFVHFGDGSGSAASCFGIIEN